MLQRVQTIYLLISLIAIILVFFFPFSEIIAYKNLFEEFVSAGLDSKIILYPLAALFSKMSLIILFSVILLMNIISIFLYKDRKLQMQICLYNLILIFIFFILISYYVFIFLEFENIKYSFSVVLPLIAFVSIFFARKGIKADEKLIRDSDRIR